MPTGRFWQMHTLWSRVLLHITDSTSLPLCSVGSDAAAKQAATTPGSKQAGSRSAFQDKQKSEISFFVLLLRA